MNLNEDFGRKSRSGDTSRWYVNRFVARIAAELKPQTRILDAGAGECAYKDYFSHCDYFAVDLAVGEADWNYSNLNCVAFLDKLCFHNDNFDAILCSQVLEHLEWPRESVREFHRVLKPGGTLYLTLPMSQNEHQVPYDFFRYTSYGIRSVCEHAGFENIQIIPFGGMFVRWAYELPRSLAIFPPVRFTKGQFHAADIIVAPVKALAMGIIRLLQAGLFAMDRFDTEKNDTFGWAVIAMNGKKT